MPENDKISTSTSKDRSLDPREERQEERQSVSSPDGGDSETDTEGKPAKNGPPPKSALQNLPAIENIKASNDLPKEPKDEITKPSQAKNNNQPPLAEPESLADTLDSDSIGDAQDLDPEKGRVPPPVLQPKNNRANGLDVADGEDEVDRASIFSYYMVHDFRYYFQHPYARLFVAYLVTFCNFLIYAEDPVAHSEKECFIPVVGNCFSFVCTRYPTNGWAFLKVLMWVLAILTGMVLGKLLVHQLLFNKLFKLKMFHGDQGSWMTMFFTCILVLFIFSWLYNGFLMIGGESTEPYRISSMMGIKNAYFMKAAATGTWCGDFFTAWMVTDIMLQEKLYPHWGKAARSWWNRDYHRIILFWVIVVVTSGVVLMVIITDWINWDFLNRDFLPSNEFSRGILASFILVMDLLIIMQDWDFPYFINNFDIKMPGLNTAHWKIDIPRCFHPEKWEVHITGKWFNYGIIFMVMILDLNMWKNQIFYEPYEYGQYTNKKGKIFTVKDQFSLENYNETQITYKWRSTEINPETNLTYLDGDMEMNSRYYGFSLGLKSIAFVPSILSFLCFGVILWYFGRWKPTEKDHYAGRLKKRRKKPKRSSIFSRGVASFRSSVTLKRFSKRKSGRVAGSFDEVDQGGSYPENWKPPF